MTEVVLEMCLGYLAFTISFAISVPRTGPQSYSSLNYLYFLKIAWSFFSSFKKL